MSLIPFNPFVSKLRSTSILLASSVALMGTASANSIDQNASKGLLSLSAAQLFSQGEYGFDRDTDMHATVFRLAYRERLWGASLSIPFLDITGPAAVIFEDEETGEEFVEEIEENRSGFGDAVASIDYKIWNHRRRGQQLRSGVAIKLPTGDEEKRLSTGETDYSIFLKGRWRKKSNLFRGQLGYQWLGDTEETDYGNRWFGTVAVHHSLTRAWGLGASARFKQASLDHRDDQVSASVYTTYRPMKDWLLNLRATRGLSDSVADMGLGLQLTYQVK